MGAPDAAHARCRDFATWPDPAPAVQPVAGQDQLYFAAPVGHSAHKKEELPVSSPTMKFAEFGDHLVLQTTSYTGIDGVGNEATEPERDSEGER